MTLYTLSFDVQGAAGSDLPKLVVKYGGLKLGISSVSNTSSTVTYTIDTEDKAFVSSDLIFGFVKDGSSEFRQITLSNILINGTAVATSGFSKQYGTPTITNQNIVLEQGQTAVQNVHAIVSDTPEVYTPPPVPDSASDPMPETFATINGDAGNNKLYGTTSADTINGNDGNDKILAYGGNDVVNGGNGNDYIDGGDGNDTLYGNDGDDKVYGGAGNDTIRGELGNDSLFGQDGNDFVYGGDGNDIIYGGAGNDRLYGEGGDDRIAGDAGDDIIYGNDGNDQLFGDDGNDTLYGGNGNDRMIGNAGNDTMYGDDGDDNMDGQDGNDTMYGGNGVDTVDGELGDDVIDGGAGDDYLIGGQGADTITGGTGNDIIHGGGIASWDQLQIRQNSAWGSANLRFSEQTQSFYLIVTSAATWTAANAAAQAATLNGAGGHLVTITSARENEIVYNWGIAAGVNSTTRLWLGATDAPQDQVWRWVGGAEDGLQFSQAGATTNNFYNGWGSGQPNNSGGNQQYGTFWYNGNESWDDRFSTDSYYYVIEWEAEIVSPDYSSNILSGGDGDDKIYGGSGNDTLNGNNDNDQLFGNAGNDVMDGGDGNDMLAGGDGNDTLTGGNGNDWLYGQDGDDLIYGDAGNDTIDGGNGTDTVTYVNAVSAVTVNLGLTTAQNTGGAGTDTILNVENLTGSNFNDTLAGNGGNNIINGGAGTDTVTYISAASAVTVSLALTTAQNTIGAGTDTLISIENLTGSNFNDTLTGDSGANTIDGGNGDDIIDGGLGNDTLIGGAGTDTLLYASATSAITVSLAITAAQNTGGAGTDTVSGFENLTGSNFNDVLTGTTGNNVINGGNGNDTIDGGLGNDTLIGGAGTDTVLYASATSAVTVSLAITAAQNTGGAGTDTLSGFENLTGSGFNDTLTGDANANTIDGGNGNDILYGGGGNDTLIGGAGNDILYGGDGLDFLTGGAGSDTFVFERAFAYNNIDRITDFTAASGGDRLNIIDLLDNWQTGHPQRGDINNYLQFVNSGGNTLVQIDANGNSGGTNFVTAFQIDGVTGLNADTLYNNGQIITI